MYQAVVGFLVGIVLLMAGMVAQQIWVSVVGFLVMLGCAVLAVTGWRKAPKPGEQPAPGSADPAGAAPSDVRANKADSAAP
ncbi:DUF3040 domain-containing protein [Actinomadura keratinilytica]